LAEKKAPIGDEEILAKRISEQYRIKHSISNDVTIDGETYEFEPREISFPSSPQYRFLMTMPKNLDVIAPEHMKIKYPSENRPEIILSSGNTTLNLTFYYTNNTNTAHETRLTQYQAIFKHLNASNVFFSEKVNELESGLKVACFDFCGSALDGDVYYYYFFTDLPATTKAEIVGTFTCPFDLREKWEPLFWQMVETIKPISDDDLECPKPGEGGTKHA